MENAQKYSHENSEMHKELLRTLDEFGITSEQLSYHQAAKRYYEFLFKGISPMEQKLFGEFNIRTTDYEMITDTQVDVALKIIKKYKPKKIFSGFKVYNHVFVCKKFYKNVRAEVLPPKEVLWQISGTSEDVVKSIKDELSTVLNMTLTVNSSDGRVL